MSKKMGNSKQAFIEYNASYVLAAGDSITFYCSNIAGGKVYGKTITNTFSTVMGVGYSELDKSLILVSLSGDDVAGAES